MLLEGTSLYFWLLFLVFLIVYITVRLCVGSLLKKMREKAWKGYIPIYSGYVLVKKLNLQPFVFYMSLIPIVNLYYYNLIIKKLLEAFAQNSNKSIWYIIFPMYKFPELIFQDPVYVEQSNYELTNEFIAAQNVLFNKPVEELPDSINLVDVGEAVQKNVDGLIINPASFQQNMETTKDSSKQPLNSNDPSIITTYINNPNDNVYASDITDEQRNKVTYVEAKEEKKPEEKPIITPLSQGKEKVCPKCGTRLAPTATTCFMCGTNLD